MANRISIYRDESVKELVAEWFDGYEEPNLALEELFYDYVSWLTAQDEMRAVMAYEDFARCLYSVGVVDVTPEGETRDWKRLETWRPSLDQVKRLKVAPLS